MMSEYEQKQSNLKVMFEVNSKLFRPLCATLNTNIINLNPKQNHFPNGHFKWFKAHSIGSNRRNKLQICR